MCQKKKQKQKTKRSWEEAQKDYTELLENVIKYVCIHVATYTYRMCVVVCVYVHLQTKSVFSENRKFDTLAVWSDMKVFELFHIGII